MGSPETLRTKNGLSKQKSIGHCLSHSQFGSRPMYHVELALVGALELGAEHVVDLLALRVLDDELAVLGLHHRGLLVRVELEGHRDELAVGALEHVRHVVRAEVGVAEVLHVGRQERAQRGERGGDGLRVAEAVEDAAAVEEVHRGRRVAVVVPVPEELVDAVAEGEHPLALHVGGLLPLGDDLAGARVPAPLGDPALALDAVELGVDLPLAPEVALVDLRLVRRDVGDVEVGAGDLGADHAGVAVAVEDLEVLEVAVEDVLLGAFGDDGAAALLDGERVGAAGLDDLGEDAVPLAVLVGRRPAVLVVELERGELRERGDDERDLAAPLVVGRVGVLGAAGRRVHEAGQRAHADVLGGLDDLRVPGPAGVLAVAARADHPEEVERVVADPDEAELGELVVADVAAAVDVDAVGGVVLLLLGEGRRVQDHRVAGLLLEVLREAGRLEPERVGAGLGEGQARADGRAVEHLHVGDEHRALLARRALDLDLRADRALLAEPAADGEHHDGLLLLVVEAVGRGRERDADLVGTLVDGDRAHVRVHAQVVEVEDALLGLGVVAVAPVVLRDGVELDREPDRHPDLLAGLRVLAVHHLGDHEFEGLPVGALRGDAVGERVRVGVHEVHAHAPGVRVALAGPAGDLHDLAGERARLRVRAPAAEGVGAVADDEAEGLVVLGRGGVGRPRVQHLELAGGRGPAALLPDVGFGIADVARGEHGLRLGAGGRRVVRERRNRARERGESAQR